MLDFENMNDSRVAFFAAMLAVGAALAFFVAAVFAGTSYANDETRMFDSKEVPDVRYVMNYEIDPALYSFYAPSSEPATELVTKADDL